MSSCHTLSYLLKFNAANDGIEVVFFRNNFIYKRQY
jgi:hypothetical protein